MSGCQTSILLLLSFIGSLHVCSCISLSKGVEAVPREFPGFALLLISAAAILVLAYVVIGCVCCPNRSIKALTYQNGFPASRLNENLQFENGSEFAIFPPHSAVIDLQPVACPAFEDKVTFEPLPDVLPRRLSGQSAACSSRPAHFRTLLKSKVSLHDWFDDPNSNFPRDQLQYLKELGCGWFGRVVEGEAANILAAEEKTAVVVKILREEASPSEHLHFLHEVRPYRDLSHPNVIRFLGRCLESDPFLLIMEHSTSDLKSHLIQQDNKEALAKNGRLLQMGCNVAAGLRHLHDNGYTHLDLAAHNCFVCRDSTVKIGDYGISFDRCRGDYYCLGDIALPVRWCSPEMVLCTETTLETKEVSREANIWAFGVILWEIFEFGKLPYGELSNEEVLQKVLIDRSTQLPLPSIDFPVKEEISMIMKECWKPSHLRPPMEKLEHFLTRLYNDRHNLDTLDTSFDERWNALQPKPAFRPDHSERSGTCSSDGERFSSLDMSLDLVARNNSQLSPSLRVLNGSADELTENCLSSVSLGREKSGSVSSDLPQLDEDPVGQEQDHLQRLRSSAPGDVTIIEGLDSDDPSRKTDRRHFCVDLNENERWMDDNSNGISETPSAVEEERKQNLSSAVPDIVIFESPLLLEGFHDENENVVDDEEESPCRVADVPKPFRFVFKEADETVEMSAKITAAPSCEARSRPLTSTPIKSNDWTFSNGFSPHDDDSGNVFDDDSFTEKVLDGDALGSLTRAKTTPGPSANDSSTYYDAPSHEGTTTSNGDPNCFASARSNFFNGDLSKVSLFPGETVFDTRAFLEAEISTVESKCPSPTEPMTSRPEDSPSLEYGEPLTPEVSINVSSYSYGNECRSISTDSPVDRAETLHSSARSDTGIRPSSEPLESGNEPSSPHRRLDSSSSDLLDSYSYSDSFPQENRLEDAGNSRLHKSGSRPAIQNSDHFYDDLENDSEGDFKGSRGALRLRPYDEVIVEDLETGEQTVIAESYSACDDYENSADSDDILKINTETDEAIIVDSSQALVGFVPSRSIELLQECEILPNLNASFGVDDEKESSDSNHLDASNSSSPGGHPSATSSPCESPDSTYPLHQPYRNFSLQNEVIEEEITDEILSPSSVHSTASFSSNDIFTGGEEKMSEGSSGSLREETSVLPSVDHFFEESDGGGTDASYSPLNVGRAIDDNTGYTNDVENNHLSKDVMYSWQPTQSVRWHSDETLDVGGDDPVVLEGREILAGGVLETHGMSVKDFTTALNRLDVEDRLNRRVCEHLSVSRSPSPYSSVESSPCRDAYTPDFESDSEEEGSCSSTSGSFECINNKFKNSVDVSRLPDSGPPSEDEEQSPLQIFSKTWDCHATPTRGVLVTPEKKLSSMRKSVSFHEEDPQVVFEYPPASDSSEDGANEPSLWNIDYQNYADWELQAGENEEIAEIEEVLEIEELDSEPYVRRAPSFGARGPMSRPMLYSLTSGFSDDDTDLPDSEPPESFAPSNSPEEGHLSEDEIGELIRNQLNNLALEENRLKWMQDVLESQASEFDRLQHDDTDRPEHRTEEFSDPEKASDESTLEKLVKENPFDAGSKNDPLLESTDESSLKEDVVEFLVEESSVASYVTPSDIAQKHSFLVNPELEWELHQPIQAAGESILSFSSALLEMPDRDDPCFPNPDDGTSNHASPSEGISPLTLEDGNKRPKHKAASDSDHEIPSCETSVGVGSTADESAECDGNDSSALDGGNSDLRLHESYQPKDESYQPKDESYQPKDESYQPKDESYQPKDESYQPKDESYQPKDESYQPKDENYQPKDENYQPKDESLQKSSSPLAETFLSSSVEKTVDKRTEEDLRPTTDIFLDSNVGCLIDLEDSESADSDISPIAEHTSAVSEVRTASNEEGLLQEKIVKEIPPAESGTTQCPDPVGSKANYSLHHDSAENVEETRTDPSLVADNSTDIEVPDTTSFETSIGTLECEPEAGNASSLSKIIGYGFDVQGCVLDSFDDKPQPRDLVPKIVITPASESEFEDELEEYLRNRLELCHRPDAEESFSVTPRYAVQPFEDVFGSYGVPGTSSDYTEAFNFEFEGGDFFDDYPNEVGLWEVPSMVEKSRKESEDSKRDPSPLYYTTSDATHL